MNLLRITARRGRRPGTFGLFGRGLLPMAMALLGWGALSATWASSIGGVSDEALLFFPGPLMTMPPDAGVPASSRAGWLVGGEPLRAGDGWWALVCDTGCTLHRTTLKVDPVPKTASLPAGTQWLRWSPLPAGLDAPAPPASPTPTGDAVPAASAPVLIGLFKLSGFDASFHPAFKPGPVVTWLHRGMDDVAEPDRPDTMDVRIPMGPGRHAVLVPRLGGESDAEISLLELRIDGRRQALAGYRPAHPGEAPGATDLVRWAGDLDGDGRLDLILSHDGQDTDVAVYLSSLASPGELVGLAGSMKHALPEKLRKDRP